MWCGISLWWIWIICPGCGPSQTLVPHQPFLLEAWRGNLKRHPLSLGALLSSSQNIGVLSTPFQLQSTSLWGLLWEKLMPSQPDQLVWKLLWNEVILKPAYEAVDSVAQYQWIFLIFWQIYIMLRIYYPQTFNMTRLSCSSSVNILNLLRAVFRLLLKFLPLVISGSQILVLKYDLYFEYKIKK